MSFPVKRGDLISYYPILKKNGIGTHKFSMDKFSSKTVQLIPRKFVNKGYRKAVSFPLITNHLNWNLSFTFNSILKMVPDIGG